MFELSVACKYLLPRRRQLSVSIISLISIFVIALVVWLIVVFFSVTDGLEKNWINKLTALTAPVRITPTEAYYNSYFYQVDGISEASGYSNKSIREKLAAHQSDPYDPHVDEEIPPTWNAPDFDAEGHLKDPVKLAYASIQQLKGIPDLQIQDFELTGSQIHLRLLRPLEAQNPYGGYRGLAESQLTYPTYLGNFDSDNTHFKRALLPLETADFNNILNLIGVSQNEKEASFDPEKMQERLQTYFRFINVNALKTRSSGWRIPSQLIPSHAEWEVYALFKGQTLLKVIVPPQVKDLQTIQNLVAEDTTLNGFRGHLQINNQVPSLEIPNHPHTEMSPRIPLVLQGNVFISATLISDSIQKARRVDDIQFDTEIHVQGSLLKGKIPYRGLEIGQATFNQHPDAPFWVSQSANGHLNLPRDLGVGDGILLPKSFKDAGVRVGDRGFLTYLAPTASTLQEQHLPTFVAGFYDPGIIPIGGKFILANRDVISIIRSAHDSEDRAATNGINVRFTDFKLAKDVKAQLTQAFKEQGISRYWNIETYQEYEFTKEIIRELQSQKNIFLVISVVIILVACSNIISMLVILVNDKKVEIGILRSMGATSKSIALIFGVAGGLIGMVGSLLGIGVAILTLKNLHWIIGFISHIQGYNMFNTAFYGEMMPQELSYEALSFVLMATFILSLLAGIVPAVKACLLRPTAILKSTG